MSGSAQPGAAVAATAWITASVREGALSCFVPAGAA
jgi:hypothetical protein